MDCRSTLSTSNKGQIELDHVVFTSIRSPMGEGYRIVGSSSQLKGDEKKEILKRSPSHGALCVEDAGAEAMSFYTLSSGRYCVTWSRYAGQEHTGRGGGRVYSDIALLSAEQYEWFGYDPFKVSQALKQAIGGDVLTKPKDKLPKLTLDMSVCADSAGLDRTAIGSVVCLATQLMHRARVIVQEMDDASRWLQCAIAIIPAGLRAGISGSYGMRYSPSRELQMVCLSPGDTPKRIQDKSLICYDWSGQLEAPLSNYEAWLKFAEQRLAAGKFGELVQLAGKLFHEAQPFPLEQIVMLCRDIEAVASADAEELERLSNRYKHKEPESPAQAELLEQFQGQLELRQEALEQAAAEAESAQSVSE